MMPSPPAGDPPNNPNGRPAAAREVRHLTCVCQRGLDEPLSLCGLAVLLEHPDTVADVDPLDEPPPRPATVVEWCVVCHDLARTALIAGRCERCTS